jgi:hypothetical protein
MLSIFPFDASRRTRTIIVLYWISLSVGGLYILALTAILVFRAFGISVPLANFVMPWFPIAAAVMLLAKALMGWSYRKDLRAL